MTFSRAAAHSSVDFPLFLSVFDKYSDRITGICSIKDSSWPLFLVSFNNRRGKMGVNHLSQLIYPIRSFANNSTSNLTTRTSAHANEIWDPKHVFDVATSRLCQGRYHLSVEFIYVEDRATPIPSLGNFFTDAIKSSCRRMTKEKKGHNDRWSVHFVQTARFQER